MRPSGNRNGGTVGTVVPPCPLCAEREAELQEIREQLAVVRADLEVAERGEREAGRALDQLRERCADLYDFAPTAYVTLDGNGFISEANREAVELLGETRNSLHGMLFMRFVAEEDRRNYLRHLSRCRRSRHPSKIATDLTLNCGDGLRQIHMISVADRRMAPSPVPLQYRTALVDFSEIRRSELALRDAESRYRLLFELNPCPMFIFDEQSLDFLDVNRAALKLYGYSREAFLEMTAHDIRPAEDVPAVIAAIRRQKRILRQQSSKENGRSRSSGSVALAVGEWRHMKRDGSLFDADITISVIQYANRQARLVLVNDITARRQAEAAMRESEARYRALFTQATDPVVVFDPVNMEVMDFNDAACRQLGYSRREFAKLKISDFDVTESAPEVQAHARRVVNRGGEVFETRQRAKNGAILDVEVRASAIHIGGRDMILGIWRDVTARKLIEEALRDAAREWQGTFDSVADAIMILDSSQRIRRCNRAASVLLGKKMTDMIGRRCCEIVHGTREPIPGCPLDRMNRSMHREFLELEMRGRWYRIMVDPLIEPDGKLRGSVYAMTDITLIKQAEVAARNMARELEQRVEARTAELRETGEALREEVKQRLKLEREVLEVSEREQRRIGQDLHDGVCQSIAGIGYLISAVQQGLVKKAKTEAVELDRVCRLAARTVQQVREIARGLFPGEIRNGRISGALQDLADHTRDVFGTDCQFEGRTDLRVADPNTVIQMYRIAQEAVNNAVKHSKAKTIRIGLSKRNGRIIQTVRDTGVGYSRTPDAPAGMGQRIMKHRADTIGATLTVAGVRGKGTTVTCELPCCGKDQAP